MLSSSLFSMHQEQTIDSYLHLLPDELNNQIACYTLCGNNPEVYADCICKVLKGHTALITSVCCTNDKIITASVDKTARIWDLKTGTLLHTLQGHTDVISSVCCTDDTIITASDDTTARIWLSKDAQKAFLWKLTIDNAQEIISQFNKKQSDTK